MRTMGKTRDKELSSLDQTFMDLCHDLKAPLQMVLGFNAMNGDKLHENIFPHLDLQDEKIAHTVQQLDRNTGIIAKEGARLAGMIDNILDMYFLEQGKVLYKIEPCSVEHLLEDISALMKAVCETKDLEWSIKYDKRLPRAQLDRHWIIRALENLFSNAVKFTEKGSVNCNITSQRGMIMFVVEDTGQGIPLQYQDTVFEKFVRAPGRGSQKGSGLGLAICKNIVEKHGGRIWFESREGKGSKFSFTIPAV